MAFVDQSEFEATKMLSGRRAQALSLHLFYTTATLDKLSYVLSHHIYEQSNTGDMEGLEMRLHLGD